MNPSIVFDIETGALPDEQLEALAPEFRAPSNWKDPEKIGANIAEQMAEWKQRAALSALTGRVVAIGLAYVLPTGIDKRMILAETPADEAGALREFWDSVWNGARANLVGFNSLDFDVPFLVRRSWVNRVKVPEDIRSGGRYWSSRFIDLREMWQLGDRRAEGSLDSVAQALGLPGKNGDGAEFAGLLKTDKAKALAYLANDLDVTVAVAERLVIG